MILGTHNSATGSHLVWWQRPFAWLINATSKCQSKSFEQQLKDGVRLFNLQVTKYRGEWVFSHGTAIYNEELFPALLQMDKYATEENPVYFNLYLDKNLFLGQPCKEFRELAHKLAKVYNKENSVKMLYAWIEGSQEYPYRSNIHLSYEERYWTMDWAERNSVSIADCIPLPKRHAKKYNKEYKKNCNSDYLMLDFYELG